MSKKNINEEQEAVQKIEETEKDVKETRHKILLEKIEEIKLLNVKIKDLEIQEQKLDSELKKTRFEKADHKNKVSLLQNEVTNFLHQI